MKTVIHLTTNDPIDAEFSLTCSRSLRSDGVDVTLPCHREGARIGLESDDLAGRLVDLVADGVDVVVSEGCLTARDLPVDVVAGTRLVPAGSVEVTRLQQDGRALLKVP